MLSTELPIFSFMPLIFVSMPWRRRIIRGIYLEAPPPVLRKAGQTRFSARAAATLAGPSEHVKVKSKYFDGGVILRQ